MPEAKRAVPTILDTDIGVDVDDFWALAFLLRCPELDIRLVVSENGDTEHGARLIARTLELAGRTDIPVGVGIPLGATPTPHAPWLGDYRLDDYPGDVHRDGVGAHRDRPETRRLRRRRHRPAPQSRCGGPTRA